MARLGIVVQHTWFTSMNCRSAGESFTPLSTVSELAPRSIMVSFTTAPWWLMLMLLSSASPAAAQTGRNLDQFNYRETVRDDNHADFGPRDWDKVMCPDEETCVRCLRICSANSFGALLSFFFRPFLRNAGRLARYLRSRERLGAGAEPLSVVSRWRHKQSMWSAPPESDQLAAESGDCR